MIVVGSKALEFGLNKVGVKLPERRKSHRSDLDIFCTQPEGRELIQKASLTIITANWPKCLCQAPDGTQVELECDGVNSTRLYLMYAELMGTLESRPFFGVELPIAPLQMLYSIKRAHRHSPKNFHKHVRDYNLLRELCGRDIFDKVTALRYKETVERERLKTPSLNKTTEDFFDDNVSNRTFVHDDIHRVMAFEDRPMFERIKVDPNKVSCSKEKFDQLNETQKLWCVQEEAYVIALERAVIPMLYTEGPLVIPQAAYEWAIMRICTTLCSGWFREWALENYDDLIFWYDKNYVNKFLRAVDAGEIKQI